MKNPIRKPAQDFAAGYDVVFAPPALEDYVRLCSAIGIPIHDEVAAAQGLSNADFAVQVRFNGECVGFCRVISDGGLWYYLVDDTVEPKHSKVGIQEYMITWLLHQFFEIAPPGAYMMAVSKDSDLYIRCGMSFLDPPEEGLSLMQPAAKTDGEAVNERFSCPSEDFGPGYEVVYEMVDAETFTRFRKIGKLGAKDPAATPISIAKTSFAVQVRYHGECIAFCRLLGDEGLWYWMADGIVLPDHQTTGVGKFFVQRLIYHFFEVAAPGAHLLAFTWAPEFGVKSGFKRLPQNEVGLYAWQPISKDEGNAT